MDDIDTDMIDFADPIRASIADDDAARIAVMERVRAAYIRSNRDTALALGLKFLTERQVTRADPNAPAGIKNRREGRALLVPGDTGAGKTTTLLRLLGRHPAFPGYGVKGSNCQLVTVSVRSPCGLKQLGRQLLDKLGYPLVADRTKDEVWEIVRAKIQVSGVRVIHFDEIQNIATAIGKDEAVNLRNTLKGLLNDIDYPVCLILSGLPEFVPFLGKDFQNTRRCRVVEFKPLAASDHATMAKVVGVLAEVAHLAADRDEIDDLVPRLVHAATRQMGIAIEMVHDAIDNALRRGAKALTLDDFADMFAQRTGNTAGCNPFIANDWEGIDCTKMLLKDDGPNFDDVPESAPKRRRRRRS
jgi:hypothetical protein